MPIEVTCSGCGSKLSTPDSAAGKRAKCPKCGGMLQIPGPQQEDDALEPIASPLGGYGEEETTAGEEDQDERKPCPACGEMIIRTAVKCRFCSTIFDKSMARTSGGAFDPNDPSWYKVRGGLANIYYGIVIVFVCFVAMMVALMVTGAFVEEDNKAPSVLFLTVFGVAGLTILGAGLTILIGQARTTAVPANSGARAFALTAFFCTMASAGLSMFGSGMESEALKSLGSLCSTIGNVFFILFIRRTAIHLDDDVLARSAARFIIFGVVLFFGTVGIGILSVVLGDQEAGIVLGILGITILVAAIVAFVWFLRLLKSLMAAIDLRSDLR